MAKINLAQAINLNLLQKAPDGKPIAVTVALKQGVNDLDDVLKAHPRLTEKDVLDHPYIRAHAKEGGLSLVPDRMAPEDVAAAAAQIIQRAQAEAEAIKAIKDAKLKEIEDALAKAREHAAEIIAKALAEADAIKASTAAEAAAKAIADTSKGSSDGDRISPAGGDNAGPGDKPAQDEQTAA